MSRARFDGEWRRFSGALKEWLGRFAGNQTWRVHGERDRWVGRMDICHAIVRRTPLI